MITARIPAAIERSIREDNLRFLQNRDLYCEDYFRFIYQLVTANTYRYWIQRYRTYSRTYSTVHKEYIL